MNMVLNKIALNVNRSKAGTIEIEKKLLELLWDNKVSVISFERLINEAERADAVFVLGGDGTVLSTIDKIATLEIPVLGINIGKLGFLTDLLPHELESAIPKILSGDYEIHKRMMLQCEYLGETYYALNEVTIDKGESPRGIFIRTEISGSELGCYFTDGIIISTPTGSTAYSMSAGGSIVSPALEAILITPICPYSLSVRPVIISGDEIVKITFESSPFEEPPSVTVDGHIRFNLKRDEEITVKKAEKKALFISYHRRSFYELLRMKLGWGFLPKIQEEK